MSNIQPTTVVGTVTQTAMSGGRSGGAVRQEEAILGPFTLRDLVIFGSVVVMLIGSVIPLGQAGGGNFWNSTGLYFLVIGMLLPLVVAAMFLIQRLNGTMAPRVGTLTADQFSSVVASFAAGYFFLLTVSNFKIAFLVSLIGSLGLLAATVAVKWLPFFGGGAVAAPAIAAISAGPTPVDSAEPVPAAEAEPVDVVASTFAESAPENGPLTDEDSNDSEVFDQQAESPVEESLGEFETVESVQAADSTTEQAAATDEPVVAAEPRIADEPVIVAETVSEPEPAREPESFGAVVDPATRPVQDTGGQLSYDAFWFAVDQPKPVVDEHHGGFVFTIEPGVWFLALQDRGQDFIVQNSDGQIGVLRDLSNIERAPENG